MNGTLSRYGFIGAFRLIRDVLITRMFYGRARIIRQPAYIRGRKNIRWGEGFTTGVGMRLDVFCNDSETRLEIGKNVQVNDYVHVAAIDRVTIGNDVLIASHVFITDHNHGNYGGADNRHCHPEVAPEKRPLYSSAVVIEEKVWIGEYVTVLPGVTIGRCSVIGAMSVVTRDIPPYSIAAGSPAKVLKQYDFQNNRWEKVSV